jgi:hypothetical protein
MPTDREKEVFRAMDAANRAASARRTTQALITVGLLFAAFVGVMVVVVLMTRYA